MAGQRMGHADADFVERSRCLGIEKIEVHRLSLSVLIGGLEGDSGRSMVNLPLSEELRSHAGLTVTDAALSRSLSRFLRRRVYRPTASRYSASVDATRSSIASTSVTPDVECPPLQILRQRFGRFSRAVTSMSLAMSMAPRAGRSSGSRPAATIDGFSMLV